MAVLLETTLGDLVIDLYYKETPKTCYNFLKLCEIKYYNNNIFHIVDKDFFCQTGDPTGKGTGGSSIYGLVQGPKYRFFQNEIRETFNHNKIGVVSMCIFNGDKNRIGSQFMITLTDDTSMLCRLDGTLTVFGQVTEGLDVLMKMNESFVDENSKKPLQNIRIKHTVIVDDPFVCSSVAVLPLFVSLNKKIKEKGLVPSRSPSVGVLDEHDVYQLRADEAIIREKEEEEVVAEEIASMNAKTDATILYLVNDLPDVDCKPPNNVLFVCKLNPVTEEDDLEVIFSRCGKINSCQIIKDEETGASLQYAFIEYEDEKSCEQAYMTMNNILIDAHRIHVDFSQSVSKQMTRQWKAFQKNGGFASGTRRRYERGDETQKSDYKVKFEASNIDQSLVSKYNKNIGGSSTSGGCCKKEPSARKDHEEQEEGRNGKYFGSRKEGNDRDYSYNIYGRSKRDSRCSHKTRNKSHTQTRSHTGTKRRRRSRSSSSSRRKRRRRSSRSRHRHR